MLSFEDVDAGTEIPDLVKNWSKRTLVKWAGASGDFYEIHYDKDLATANGLPGVIVHGWLAYNGFAQLLQQWIGIEGDVKKISCSYRGMLLPDQDATFKGKVAGKRTEGGENLVDCELWCENHEGNVTTQAQAVVVLPSKS